MIKADTDISIDTGDDMVEQPGYTAGIVNPIWIILNSRIGLLSLKSIAYKVSRNSNNAHILESQHIKIHSKK